MTSYRLVITRRAATDLDRIHRYIAKASPHNAAKVLGGIFVAIDALTLTPHRNVVAVQPTSRLDPVRSLPVDPYMVFFRVVDSKRIGRLLRVRHGSMRPPRRFG
jgi:plasmid stabilization system protein ParE